MFNVALDTLWNAQVTANPGTPLGTIAPYFYLDPDSQLISLVLHDEMIQNSDISINDASLNYLQGFDLFYERGNPPAFLTDKYHFNYYQTNNICNQYGGEKGIPGGDFWYYTQEYRALDLWSDLRKIFITTSSISVKAEEKAVNLPNGTQTGLTSYVPVLFDYTPVFTDSASSRTISYYVPQSQYRLVDILSTEPLTKISMELFWQDTLGDIYPLYIQIYQAINIKLGFFRKSIYKNYYPGEDHPTDKYIVSRRK
jgi:hypothetical protein